MDDSPMKLQTLAAKSVCVRLVYDWAEGEMPLINVWKRDISDDAEDGCPAHNWFLWQLNEMEVPRFANISSEVHNQIEDNMPPILDEVTRWIMHHHLCHFFHDEPSSSLSEYIVKLVWNHRCFKIDYAATAKNILTNEMLSPLERFKFASTYCIVDEIEKFRDTMDSVPEWELREEAFVAYWYRYLTNKLDAIDVPKDSSIEMWYLKTSKELCLWSSVAHFFEKVDSTSRSAEFECILEIFAESNLSDLLGKLTDKKWNLACRSSISKIVEQIVQYGTLNQVQLVWKLFRSEMDSKNFCGILETLVPLSMRNAKDFEKWTPLLMEIWTRATNKLKQSAIVDMKLWQSIGEKYVSIIAHDKPSEFRARRRQISDPMKFIRLVLKSMPVEKRMEFFERNFYWLIVWAPLNSVDQLMRDFLERYNRDVVKLKKVVANCSEIERSRGILIAKGEFDELDVLVSFYFPGVDGFEDIATNDDGVAMQNEMKIHKYEFILSESAFDAVCFCVYRGDWKPFYEYVQKNVWYTPMAVEVIMRKAILRGKYWIRRVKKGEMNDLKEFVSTVYANADPAVRASADAQLKLLKERYESYALVAVFDNNRRHKRIFDRAALRDFLLWIYDGDERLIEENFKQPHLFPKGFLVQLKGCVAEGSFQVTKSMDEYLKWCFATEAERQQFKRKMIYDYREHKMIEGLLIRREYRRRMLLWFFDEDTSLIEKFTTDCARNTMYSYFTDITDYSSDDSDDDGGKCKHCNRQD